METEKNQFNNETQIVSDVGGRIDRAKKFLNEFILERYSVHPVTVGAILHGIDRLSTNPTALTLKDGIDAIFGGFMFSFGISYARNSWYPRQILQHIKDSERS